MQLCFNFNLILLLLLGVLIERSKTEELNLNFQQNDYQLKFERAELIRYNKNVAKDVSIVTFKYNRTIAVINATFTTTIDLGNAIVGVIQAYKFMINEYRTFPMRFGANSCKAMAANVAGTNRLGKCGNFTGCPFRKGMKNHICNWYPDQSKFPPFIPNGEYKIEIQLLHASIEVAIVNAYITVSRPVV